MESRNYYAQTSLSLETIGFITWLVFLILKLCNQNNPDFAWLTWFWVWFPFWLPLAIDLALLIIIVPICFILALKDADY